MLNKKLWTLLLIVPAMTANNAVVFAGDCAPEWSALGEGSQGYTNTMAVFDDGSGPALYADGYFPWLYENEISGGIARWDGTSWSPLGSGLNNNFNHPYVGAMVVFDDGSGPSLYAGGTFGSAGASGASNIARWDGAAWSPLGTGTDGVVLALTVFDDGSGPALYAGGEFTQAGGIQASGIARWDGTAWSSLGAGVSGVFSPSVPSVFALTVFDDGSGPALYAGGFFTQAGGNPASHIARWDGAAWSPLGLGVQGLFPGFFGNVTALRVFDDGNGPALYAGGLFTQAGGSPASRIARWDGAAWSVLGLGVNSAVYALEVFDDGSGPSLYAGGVFEFAGGNPANAIARWDGAAWSPLGDGVTQEGAFLPSVHALVVFDDGASPALYAGGQFVSAGGVAASNIARWGSPCSSAPCPADVTGNNAVDLDDLNLVLSNFGSQTFCGDTNSDGVVDLDDLNAVLTAFGTVCD